MGGLSDSKALSMRRFWLDKENIGSNTVEFTGDSYNHLVRVSRKSIGDQVEVLYGESKALVVEIIEVSKKSAVAKILAEKPLPALAKPHLELAFCFPKPAVFEAVLEKSVELGVAKIQPLFNENSFLKAPRDIKQNKWERWQKIVAAATTQTIRGEIMKILSPMNLMDYAAKINREGSHLGLFFYEGESANSIKSYLQQCELSKYDSIQVIVGSEGGFAPQEVKALCEMGFKPITIGPQILRAETACVAIMSVIKYEADQMQ